MKNESATLPTKERLVTVARDLFARKGYAATGTAEILAAAGVNRGSLYHAFPGKQDLLRAVLQSYLSLLEVNVIQRAWAGTKDPVGRIFSLLGLYREFMVSTDFHFGCPMGQLALELRDPDPQIRDLLSENFNQWRGHAEDCFTAVEANLPPEVTPRQLAAMVLIIMEGGVMLARTHRSLEDFDDAVSAFRDYLRRLGLGDQRVQER